jgi:hypothetical protein
LAVAAVAAGPAAVVVAVEPAVPRTS